MPGYIFPLAEYVRQIELPRGWKFPKFTKFAGDTSESTVEHVVRYQTEADDIENNEKLKIKYFPNSLTKTAFTWFTILHTNLDSIKESVLGTILYRPIKNKP